jgi:hypothetical protein
MFAFGNESKIAHAVDRYDFIRAAWANGKPRSEIAKELTRLVGRYVTYRLVFDATRGTAGGPPQEES